MGTPDVAPLPNFSTDLTGRVALVTGASSGLGRRFARVLAACGAQVIVCARRYDRLLELVAEIEADGGSALALSLDARDASNIIEVFDQGQGHFGVVDILINNAGISDADYATRLSLDKVDAVIDTNFRAPFLLSCEFSRRLIDAGQPGRIVNLSSIGAYSYNSHSAAALYSATKAGIARLTETLAIEWARYGINVNAIAPGLFRSEMSAAHLDAVGEKILKPMPRQRVGQPWQLDSTLLYLVSPSSDFVTGTCVIVDDVQLPR